MQDQYESNAKGKLIATCLLLVVIAGLVVVIDHLKSKPAVAGVSTTQSVANTTPTSTTTSSNTSTQTSTASTSSYKDGTYTADSQYYVPHGQEDIKVTLTIQNGIVTNSNVVNSENDPTSADFQESFASSYTSAVVGKSIGNIHLSYVAGASDTTNGFNNALNQIKQQAQA